MEKIKRQPKCSRCRNHNREIPLRGHKNYCPYRSCQCSECSLVIMRQKVMAAQVALRRKQSIEKERQMNVVLEPPLTPPADIVLGPVDIVHGRKGSTPSCWYSLPGPGFPTYPTEPPITREDEVNTCPKCGTTSIGTEHRCPFCGSSSDIDKT